MMNLMLDNIPWGVFGNDGARLYDPGGSIPTRKSNSLSIQGHGEESSDESLAT